MHAISGLSLISQGKLEKLAVSHESQVSWLQTGEKTGPSRILPVSSRQGVYKQSPLRMLELEENFVVLLILWVMIQFLSFLTNRQTKVLQLKEKKKIIPR